MPTINSVAVDERYAANVVPQLRTNTFLVPGVTYNDRFIGGSVAAGKVTFYKFAKSAVASAKPGTNFSHGTPANDDPVNSVTSVYLQNDFKQSKDIRGIIAAEMTPNLAANVQASQMEDIREGRELCAIAALKYWGTAQSDTTDPATGSALIGLINDAVTAVKTAGGKPGVILVSPAKEGLIRGLPTSSTPFFIPETNEQLIRYGVVGRLFGCIVVSNSGLGNASNTAVLYSIDETSAKSVTLAKTDFIVYDPEWFALADSFATARVVDEPSDFVGVHVQTEVLSGIKVLDTDTAASSVVVAVHTHA